MGKDIDSIVSFSAGKPWGTTLSLIANEYDLQIDVYKFKRRVIVEKSPENRGNVAVIDIDPASNGLRGNKIFELIPGETLSASLNRWAKSEGWSLIYGLDNDLRIDVYASFEGNLLESVEHCLSAYKASGILTRVNMTYSYANKSIKVSLSPSGTSGDN